MGVMKGDTRSLDSSSYLIAGAYSSAHMSYVVPFRDCGLSVLTKELHGRFWVGCSTYIGPKAKPTLVPCLATTLLTTESFWYPK